MSCYFNFNFFLDRYNGFLDTRNSLNCARDTESFTFRTLEEYFSRKSAFLDDFSATSESYGYNYNYDYAEWAFPVYLGWGDDWERQRYAQREGERSKDEFSYLLDFFRRHQGQIYQESRTCQLYTVSINDYAVPVFTTWFKEAVLALHEASANPESADSEAAIKKFWSQYGTHYMSRAAMGGSLTVESRWASNAITSRDSARR